jgi:hypothetical protein
MFFSVFSITRLVDLLLIHFNYIFLVLRRSSPSKTAGSITCENKPDNSKDCLHNGIIWYTVQCRYRTPVHIPVVKCTGTLHTWSKSENCISKLLNVLRFPMHDIASFGGKRVYFFISTFFGLHNCNRPINGPVVPHNTQSHHWCIGTWIWKVHHGSMICITPEPAAPSLVQQRPPVEQHHHWSSGTCRTSSPRMDFVVPHLPTSFITVQKWSADQTAPLQSEFGCSKIGIP